MKERLIGAVVLVTVAWLLIPVFLDSNTDAPDAMTTRTVSLPGVEGVSGDADDQMRTVTLRARDSAASEPPPNQPPVEIELPAPERIIQPTDDADEAATSPSTEVASEAQPADEVESESASPDDAEPDVGAEVVADVAPEPQVSPPPAVAASPQTEADTSTSQSAELWVVQVGSFGQRANAEALMKRLIDGGFPAFVSEIQASGRTMHRVRVGPQKNRAAADAMVARLKAAGQDTARSVRYP
ncbi:MAG: SPOR domain-containing protein [Pseudomonadota bacterium]